MMRRDRQALAEQHHQQLLLAEADHLQELAAQSARATQDAARAQAAEEQLFRGRETGSVVAKIAATFASTVTAVTESACVARAETADLRNLLSARD